VLYEADLMGLDPMATLRLRLAQADPPVPPYAIDLVEGVFTHRGEIDRIISSIAEGWTLARMPAIDRNVLRLGAYELLFNEDVPEGVAVSEAVDLAGRLSTDESAAFVNGVLSKVAERRVRVSRQNPEGSDGLDSAPRVG
jgi:N utilization substance protein B